MGAHSSLCITREKALSLWREASDWEPSNQCLESWLDRNLEGKLYNVCITPEDEVNDYNSGSWLTVDYLLGE